MRMFPAEGDKMTCHYSGRGVVTASLDKAVA